MEKQLKRQAFTSLAVILLLLFSFSAATYAWFTFSPDVNVQPMSGTIGETDGSLLISASREGPFDTECQLNVTVPAGGMNPLSTADPDHFYAAGLQNAQELIVAFKNADDQVDSNTIHGRLFLKSLKRDTNVYFNRSALDFGTDVQALAAMRLALKVRLPGETLTYIFYLDDMGQTAGALVHPTVPEAFRGMVVRSDTIGENDAADMIADPARSIADYSAISQGETYTLGKTALFPLPEDQIAEVEFWLYLEGCDDNCYNVVQDRDTALALAFFGQTADKTE